MISNFFGNQKSSFIPNGVQKDDAASNELQKALANGFRVDAVRPARREQELGAAGGTVLKSAGTAVSIYVPILRKDAARREIHGIIAQEQVDKSNEIFDYASSKPYFQQWSADAMERTTKADLPISYGNVRAQHSKIAAGKLIHIEFDDANKCIPVVAKIVDDNEWKKVQEGVYSGFSVGGKYIRKWADGGSTRYTAQPSEVSIVDSPCMPSATFSAVKSAGADDDMVRRSDGFWVRRRDLQKTDAVFAQTLAEIARLVKVIRAAADAGPRRFGAANPDADAKALLDKSRANPIAGPHDGQSSTFKTAQCTASPGVRKRSDGTLFGDRIESADVDADVRKALENPIRR
jgi:hypothetical protein